MSGRHWYAFYGPNGVHCFTESKGKIVKYGYVLIFDDRTLWARFITEVNRESVNKHNIYRACKITRKEAMPWIYAYAERRFNLGIKELKEIYSMSEIVHHAMVFCDYVITMVLDSGADLSTAYELYL